MKKINSIMILRILACVYLLMSLVFMGNLSLILFDFKPILPDSLTNIIFKLVLGNFTIACFISCIFGFLIACLVRPLKSNITIVKKKKGRCS